MRHDEISFLRKAAEPPATLMSVPRRVHVLWEDEHRHALLTGALLLIVGAATWAAGLRIAPVGCAIFAAVLLAVDLAARRHR